MNFSDIDKKGRRPDRTCDDAKVKGKGRHYDQSTRCSDNGEDSEYLPDRLPSKRSGQS